MALLEKAITTQEEFDAAIGDRLKREKESAAKKYEGYTSPDDLEKIRAEYDKQIKSLQEAAAASEKTLAEKDAKIAEGAKYKTDLEKTRIALAAGLKIDYADRLRGDNEDEWKKDAELLAKDFAASHTPAPIGNPDPMPKDNSSSNRAALRGMLNGLNLKGE